MDSFYKPNFKIGLHGFIGLMGSPTYALVRRVHPNGSEFKES
jgi:hypothetical protein